MRREMARSHACQVSAEASLYRLLKARYAHLFLALCSVTLGVTGGLTLATVGVLTPWKLADATVSPEPIARHSPAQCCHPTPAGTFTGRKAAGSWGMALESHVG